MKIKQIPDWKKVTAQELMKLPIAERRRIIRRQVEAARPYYLNNSEVKDLGGGDFIDY